MGTGMDSPLSEDELADLGARALMIEMRREEAAQTLDQRLEWAEEKFWHPTLGSAGDKGWRACVFAGILQQKFEAFGFTPRAALDAVLQQAVSHEIEERAQAVERGRDDLD